MEGSLEEEVDRIIRHNFMCEIHVFFPSRLLFELNCHTECAVHDEDGFENE